MFDCAEYQRAVANARKLSTRSKKVFLDYVERSQTTPSTYSLKIRLDKKWSSSDASLYSEGTAVQKDS